jgi:APA family basic amino acid/polyamine antiporter
LRKRRLGDPGAILTAGYPLTPIAFLALVAMLLFAVAMHSPRETALGIVAVLAGIPVYALFQRRAV